MQNFDLRQSWRRILPLLVCVAFAGCSWVRAMVDRHSIEAERLAKAAHRAEETGDLAEAESLLTQASKAKPEDVDIRRHLSEVLLTQGKKAEAAEQLQVVLENAPDDANGHARLAQLYYDLDRLDVAEESLDRALALDPKLTGALLLKSELAVGKNDDKLALETCHRALATDAENVEAQLRIAAIHLRMSEPDRAAPVLRSVCQNSRATEEQIAQARWSLGVAYGQQQRWEEAAVAIAAALEHRQNATADDWYRLAYAHYFAGDINAALRDVERALMLQPGHTDSKALVTALNVQVAESAITPTGYFQPTIPRPAGW